MNSSLPSLQTGSVRSHAGPVARAALLVEEHALDALRVALQRERAVAQVRERAPARSARSSR